jgi:hypothetical protein
MTTRLDGAAAPKTLDRTIVGKPIAPTAPADAVLRKSLLLPFMGGLSSF